MFFDIYIYIYIRPLWNFNIFSNLARNRWGLKIIFHGFHAGPYIRVCIYILCAFLED